METSNVEVEEVQSLYESVAHRSGQTCSVARANDAAQGSITCYFCQPTPVPPAAAKAPTAQPIDRPATATASPKGAPATAWPPYHSPRVYHLGDTLYQINNN